ncbi:MAG: MoaD/ThiS family protein [Candidatus Aenigmatarchaeota archaeon]|nr:MAG: MoaD/ThiS family protein [Candidatus Aenigmarchaeota archaeon]
MVNVKISYMGKTRTLNMPEKSSIENLLEKLEINPETVVVLKNGEVVPDFEMLSNKDRVEILDIVSRG